MNNARTFIAIGAINGFLAVAFGAFAAHALKNIISPGMLQTFQTGVQYQGIHALALLAVGLLAQGHDSRALNISGWSFATGILLFSGSLYLLSLIDARMLGIITPFGGVAFLIGWAALAWAVIRSPE